MNNRIEVLKKLLEENKTVSDYRINRTGRTSSELFFVHRNLETSRATDVCDMNVTVYVDHDGKKGESSFAVYESMTETDLRLKIAEAADTAGAAEEISRKNLSGNYELLNKTRKLLSSSPFAPL